ncbi:unnamed protein product [Psylliodes chrysocephalus]|uniref:HAT C-terminal dimerisation domain-containing protein n=1 Tax=Psylliodes chrysocephalus TaxID=3402493 RepID=A0A9P0D0Z6_9CUCU|nr:unnamed protein product [Psylliodes chrysocephala]
MYFGAYVEEYIEKNKDILTEDDIQSFKHKRLAFYTELCTQIKNRFPFENALLENLNVLEPKIAYSGNIPSLTKLLNCFPVLKDKVNIEKLNLEWRIILDLKEMETHLDELDTFWSLLLCQKDGNNDFQFSNLIIVTTYVFSLPHFSASAERMYSQLFLIKTKPRNRLLIETCQNLLHTKFYVSECNKVCYNFTPNDEILKRNVVYPKQNQDTDIPHVALAAQPIQYIDTETV